MALIHGSKLLGTGTAATDFVGAGNGTGAMDTNLLAAGWKYIETIPAAYFNGTTGAGDVAGSRVQVWRSVNTVEYSREQNTAGQGGNVAPNQSYITVREAMASDGVTAATDATFDASGIFDYEISDGKWYDGVIMYIEVDDVNQRIRMRTSERYYTSPRMRGQYAAPGINTVATSNPTTDGAVKDGLVLGETTEFARTTINITNGVTVFYTMRIGPDEFIMSVARPGGNNDGSIIIGKYTPLPAPNLFSVRDKTLWFCSQAGLSNYTAAGVEGRTTRALSHGVTAGFQNPFSVSCDFAIPTRHQASAGWNDVRTFGSVGGTAAQNTLTGFPYPLVGDAVLHVDNGTNESGLGGRKFLGYLPDAIVAARETTNVTQVFDKLEVRTDPRWPAGWRQELFPGPVDDTTVGLPPRDDDEAMTQFKMSDTYSIVIRESRIATGGISLLLAIK